MKHPILDKVLKIVSLVLACFNAIVFLSMRPCWSGISKTLGYENGYNPIILYFPIIVFVILLVLAILNIVFFIALRKKGIWNLILLPLNIIFTAAIAVIFVMGAADYVRFIAFDLVNILGILLVAAIILFFIFWYPKTTLKDSKVFHYVTLGALVLGSAAAITEFNVNFISYEPVVYVVEDEYQIVFSSNAKSLGWVEIAGKNYYDLYAGSEKSEDRVHKIVVPQAVLDEAKSYTVHTQRFLYRGPFGAYKGNDISKTYSFRPVDTSDGLNYYSLSDIHNDGTGAVNAASFDAGMELLILNGDITSMVGSHFDANYANEVAFNITHGEIPVVYARGNHDIKGDYAESLYKYVGSKNEKFYYTFTLGDVYGLVLDWGEDHDDDWWEYYGTADFEGYRNEQIDFLQSEIEKGDYASAKYRLAVCHVPLTFINSRKNHVESKKAVVEKLNQMNIDMLLAGHQHELYIFEPGQVTPLKSPMTYNAAFGGKKYKGYLLDFNFPSLMVSKHGYTQTDDKDGSNLMIGMTTTVDFAAKKSKSFYNNTKGQKVSVVNPFSDKDYGEEIDIDLVTKAMN